MKPTINIGVKAEWNKAKDILVSTPGAEMFSGVLHPEAASFEKSFNTQEAAREHKEFTRVLTEECGVNVRNVGDILKSDQDKLRTLATQCLQYKLLDKNLNPVFDNYDFISGAKKKAVKNMSEPDLLRILFEKPCVVLRQDDVDKNSFVLDHYRYKPVMNHFFQRDQQIVTDKGLVIGRMKNPVRVDETEMAREVFEIMGVSPIYVVAGDGTLEGGDYIPAGNYAFIGQGLRTNEAGVSQLLENQVFGFDEIAVVHDFYRQQDEMHLDTYFNFVGSKKAIILDERLNNPDKIPLVETYIKNADNSYSKQTTLEEKLTFETYLKSKGVDLIPLPKEWQENYGINILTISDSQIVAVKNPFSDKYVSLMSSYGIRVIEVDMTNLTKGYGGPHCMTQVLFRD